MKRIFPALFLSFSVFIYKIDEECLDENYNDNYIIKKIFNLILILRKYMK